MKTNGRIQLFPLLRVAAVFAIGIAVGDAAWNDVPGIVWSLSAVVLLVVSWFFRNRPITHSCVLMGAVGGVGAWLAACSARSAAVVLPDGPVAYEAVVVSRPETRGKVVRADLLVASGRFAGRRVKASFLRGGGEDASRLGVGDGVGVVSSLERPVNFRPSSNFDYVRWLATHGFVARTQPPVEPTSGLTFATFASPKGRAEG